jgi:hypothetical protein
MLTKNIFIHCPAGIFGMAPGHIHHHEAQEKPLDGEQDDAPARLPNPPEFEDPEENVDSNFSDFFLPQEGHFT